MIRRREKWRVTARAILLNVAIWIAGEFLPASTAAQICAGDCDSSGRVVIGEVVLGVSIALQRSRPSLCANIDVDRNGQVEIDELVLMVRHALDGCPGPSPTPTRTRTMPSPTATRTVPAVLPSPAVGGIEVQVFTSDNGTVYYVLRADLQSGGGAGVQVTSLAVSSGEIDVIDESVRIGDSVLTAIAGATPNGLSPLETIWRTEILTDLPSNQLGAASFAPAAANGDGLLFLPGGTRAVTASGTTAGLGTEPVFPITEPTSTEGRLVPSAATTQMRRRSGGTLRTRDSIVFPGPGTASCVAASSNAGRMCSSDSDCGAECSAIGGNGCCAEKSLSPTCRDDRRIVCDPTEPGTCVLAGGCTSLGGESDGQTVTLDDTFGSRVGNEETQLDEVDGFYLRRDTDLIVFIAESDLGSLPLRAGAAGFVVTGRCANGASFCAQDGDCSFSHCEDDIDNRLVAGAAAGRAAGTLPPAPDDFLTIAERYRASVSVSPVRAVAIDPKNGNHVYVGAGDSVQAYETLSNGGLRFLKGYLGGSGGISGLEGVCAVVTSPEGDNLYVAGRFSLAVFARDTRTGALTWLQTERDGICPAIALSEDGRHLYTALGPRVRVRERLNGGRLSAPLQEITVEDAVSVAVSPATGTGEPTHVYVTGNMTDGNMLVFERDTTTGKLVQRGSLTVESLGPLVLSPDGNHMYIYSSFDDSIFVYERDAVTGELTRVQEAQLPGRCLVIPCGAIAVSPDGKHVYAGYLRTLAIYSRAKSGILTLLGSRSDGLGGVAGITVSPSSQDVYVASGSIVAFRRDGKTVRFVEEETEVDAGFDEVRGATDITVSSDGRHAYVIASDFLESERGIVVTFRRNSLNGSLEFVDALRQGENGVDGIRDAKAMTLLPPDEEYLLVLGDIGGMRSFSTIAVFRRNRVTGALSYAGRHPDFVAAPNLAASPDGTRLYTSATFALSGDPLISVFSTNEVGDGVRFTREGTISLPGFDVDVVLTLSNDGEHLYAGNRQFSVENGLLTVLERSTQPPGLRFVDEGTRGLQNDELYAVGSGVVSPNGRYAYFSANSGSELIGFSRDPSTGTLTYLPSIVPPDLCGNRPAFDSQRNLVYTACEDLNVFHYASSTGELSFVDNEPVNPIGGFAGPFKISPDGAYIYVIADRFSVESELLVLRVNRR